MKFRKWLMLLGVTLLAFILVACSNDESASNDNGEKSDNTESSDNNNLEANSGEEEVVELSFWVFGNAGYDVLAEEYMEDHPNIKINVNEGEMEDMLDNLFTSISAGSGAPDIAMIEISRIAKFLEAEEQFYNLNDFGAQDLAGDFLDWKWAQAQNVDGSFQIGLPTDIGPTTMFYRTDVMEEAGFPTDPEELAAEMKTWDDYYEAAKQIKEVTGKPITDSPELMFNAIRDQKEQQYFNENDELIIEDTVKEAYDLTTKMLQEELVGKNELWTPEWGSSMAEGSYATLIGAPAWMIANVKENAPDAAGKWSLTTIPEGAGNWGGSFMTIPKESDHPEEAFAFISWLTSPEIQLKSFTNNGLFPSTPWVYDDEEFLATTDEYFSGEPTAQIFAEAAESVKTVYMGKNYAIVNSELINALMNVALEGVDPQDEWDQAVERINSQLERQ